MASPHPVPTAIKQARGNPGKRPLNKNEPKPSTDIPPCPEDMPPEGKKAWEFLLPELKRIGVITRIDVISFRRYCQNLADWHTCQKFINDNGTDLKIRDEEGNVTGVVPYPQVKRKREIEVLLLRYEDLFGLNPSSRSKVQAVIADQEDDLEKLLNAPLPNRE